MVVISFLLVILAAVSLVVGLFQDGIEWIWASIAACVLAMIFLGIGVLQRRSAPVAAGEDEDTEYTPGAIRSLMGGESATAAAEPPTEVEAEPEPEVAVVPKRTAPAETAALADDDEPADVDELDDIITTPSTPPAEEAAARTAPRKEATKRAPARKKATTGVAARRELANVKGLGEAKAAALLEEFRSLEAVKAASVEELTAVKGVGPALAEQIATSLAASPAGSTTKRAPARKKATTGVAARRELANVKGLGEAKAAALLEEFRSLEAVKAASVEELTAVKGVGPALAEQIRESL